MKNIVYLPPRKKGYRLYTFIFGLACIVDGLIRVLSFGFVCSSLQCEVAKRHAKLQLKCIKKETNK